MSTELRQYSREFEVSAYFGNSPSKVCASCFGTTLTQIGTSAKNWHIVTGSVAICNKIVTKIGTLGIETTENRLAWQMRILSYAAHCGIPS